MNWLVLILVIAVLGILVAGAAAAVIFVLVGRSRKNPRIPRFSDENDEVRDE